MRLRLVCLAVAVGLAWAFPRAATAEDLSVGSSAPPITVSGWVKGEPVERLDPAKTYVVEFWATWCGPCRTSIPHLTELQKKYKDRGVTFLGVSVWEQDQEKVEPFVKEMGDKMAYTVALDDVAKGEKGNEGKMAKAWMQAANQNGIPAAFLVKDAKIYWIGHPMSLDEPLEKIVAGNWDLETAARDYREAEARKQKLQAIYTKVAQSMRSGKPKEALAAIDEAITEDPALEQGFGYQKFMLLRMSGQSEEATAYGTRLAETVFKGNAQALNFIAWTLVDPKSDQKPSKGDLELAMKAARRADELTENKDAAIIDTLAKVYFDSGDPAKALELQEKAVKLLEAEENRAQIEQSLREMKERRDQYRKALDAKGV